MAITRLIIQVEHPADMQEMVTGMLMAAGGVHSRSLLLPDYPAQDEPIAYYVEQVVTRVRSETRSTTARRTSSRRSTRCCA